jgi:hypothetical protein
MNPSDTPPPASNSESTVERDLLRIMTFSTSLGFGTLAAFLCSLRDIKDDVSFVFSIRTVVAFLGGAAAGWFFWRMVKRKTAREPGRTP